MSHTYEDKESGVVFHYNPDLSGGITIVSPISSEAKLVSGVGLEVTIPAAAIRRFFFCAIMSGDEIVNLFGSFSEVMNRIRELQERFADHAFTGNEKSLDTYELPKSVVLREQAERDVIDAEDKANHDSLYGDTFDRMQACSACDHDLGGLCPYHAEHGWPDKNTFADYAAVPPNIEDLQEPE